MNVRFYTMAKILGVLFIIYNVGLMQVTTAEIDSNYTQKNEHLHYLDVQNTSVLAVAEIPKNVRMRNGRESSSSTSASIKPQQTITRHDIATGIIPEVHDSIIVGNIGLTDLELNFKYGLLFDGAWVGSINKFTIKPSEMQRVILPRPYYRTAMDVYNPDKYTRGVIMSWRERRPGGMKMVGNMGQYSPRFQFDAMKFLRMLTLSVVNKTPYVGGILHGLVGYYWPLEQKNTWAEVMDEMEKRLTNVQISLMNRVLKQYIDGYKARIEAIRIEVDQGLNIAEHFMHIAEDMIGLNGIFNFDQGSYNDPNLSFHSLPLFSRTMNLKLSFYTWGILYAEKLGLTGELLDRVKRYRQQTVDYAIQYVDDLYQSQQDRAYETCDAENFYNEMMNVRRHIKVHGLEYIPYWKSTVDPKHIDQRLYISHSEFYGIATYNLYKQTMDDFKSEPLTPSLVPVHTGPSILQRNKLKSIEMISCWPDKLTLCGLKLRFENNNEYSMGSVVGVSYVLELNGARINKLRVGGNGAIDYLDFYLSDERGYVPFGKRGTTHYVDYELENHHIVSMFVSNDVKHLGFQIANIAVSYQLNPIDFDMDLSSFH